MKHLGAIGILMLVSASTMAGDYEIGIGYSENRMYAKAALSFFSAAKGGDARAIRELATAYLQGSGVEKDDERSIHLMEMAANLGDTKAQVLYGAMCFQRVGGTCSKDDTEKAYSWFLIAGESEVIKNGYANIWAEMNNELDETSNRLQIDARQEARNLAENWQVNHVEASTPHDSPQELSAENLASLEQLVQITKIENQVQQEEAAEKRKHDEQIRIQGLRSGRIKITNIKDAWLAQSEISDLMKLMAAPLIQPNRAIYGARLKLDAKEYKGVLRAMWDRGPSLRVFAPRL